MDRDLTRFAFLPIHYEPLHELYKKQRDVFWVPNEIDYTNDRSHWERTTDPVRQYIGFLVKLFAQLDGIVNENLNENFKRETSVYAKECSNFYAIQEAIEVIHNETYSLLIKTFFRDPKEQMEGLNSIKYNPAIKKIAEWCFEWMDSKRPLPERVIAFACIEGIIFSSAFAGIYWVKRMNILPGLTKANEWIARDEAIHRDFGVLLYHYLTKSERDGGFGKIHGPSAWGGEATGNGSPSFTRLPQARAHEIVRSAVSVAEEFTREAMNCNLVGLDAEDMVKYVKTTGDALVKSLGYDLIWRTVNPFDWMVIISLPNQQNFFEGPASEYSKPGEEVHVNFHSEGIDFNKPF